MLRQIFFVFCFSFSLLGAPAKTEAVIIGAGLSGLASARLLKKHNIPFHILEIAPIIGGRVKTVEYKKPGKPTVSADSGMEEYWESNPATEILKELKLPLRIDIAISSLNLMGKLYTVGDDTVESYQKKFFNAEELKSLHTFKTEVTPIIHHLREIHLKGGGLTESDEKLQAVSFKDYLEAKKIPEKVREWIRISVECEIGTHWDRISALEGLYEFHIFLGDGEKSYRVMGGNHLFTKAFAKSIGLKNISLNHRVNRITTKNNKVTVTYIDAQTNTSGTIEAKHVISTIPLYRLFEVQIDPPLSEEKQKAINSMGWGSYFKAHLFFPRKSERFWTKEDSSILPILSDSDLGVIYDGNPSQEKGSKIISLLIFGDTAEKYNMMPQGQVAQEVRLNLEKQWPGIGKELEDIEFYRYHPRAIASWPVGRSRLDALSQTVRQPENRVYLAGDHTESTHSEGAFIAASRVVSQILKDRSK